MAERHHLSTSNKSFHLIAKYCLQIVLVGLLCESSNGAAIPSSQVSREASMMRSIPIDKDNDELYSSLKCILDPTECESVSRDQDPVQRLLKTKNGEEYEVRERNRMDNLLSGGRQYQASQLQPSHSVLDTIKRFGGVIHHGRSAPASFGIRRELDGDDDGFRSAFLQEW